LASTREARDSYFLIGVVLLAVAPHLLRLPTWATAMVLLLLGWRVWLAAKAQALPSRWLLIGLLLVAVLATRLSHGVLIGREAGLTLVCLLVAMKLLEMHARRDAFVVFFLGFFLVLAQYLHSQSLWVAIWTLAAVWGLLTSLVLAQMPLGQPSLQVAGREAARSTLLGLPIMVLLFLLFPRIGPLWGLPGQVGGTGLSDTLRFGDVAELALDEGIAMRLRALDGQALPAASQLYVRGPVLTQFDGQQWKADPVLVPRREILEMQGRPLRYEALLEPQRLPILPVLEMSPGQPGESWSPQPGLELQRTLDLSWVARRVLTERVRFEQVAILDRRALRIGPFEEHPSLRRLRQQPGTLNPRLQAWARELARDLPIDGSGAPELSQRLLHHIRRLPFSYTLAPGIYGELTPHAVDEFWFDRREGFCEHYASAYVLALRAAGVPARIVTGFQGADAELVDGWTTVRNSNAHAWAEYWTPGLGWQRVDPTAAVAPDRVERGRLLQPSPGVLRGAVNAFDPTLWLRLRQFAEGVDLRWQRWVLGYQQREQFRLLESLGFKAPDWNTLGRLAATVIAVLAVIAWIWQRLAGRGHSPWSKRLAQVHARLQSRGWPAGPHHAPLRWAQSVRAAGGPDAVVQVLLQLESWRYGPQAEAVQGWRGRWQEARRWRQWWRNFRRALASPAA
jgi:hypothetical protein